MKSYPLDLRQRIVEAVDQHLGPIEEIAGIFKVHSSYIYKLLRQRRDTSDLGPIEEIAGIFKVPSSYVYKLLRQRRDTSDLAPLPHGGGASAKLEVEERGVLAELVAEHPDATLDELRDLIRKKKRVRVSVSTVWRWLEALALTRKKSLVGRAKPTR